MDDLRSIGERSSFSSDRMVLPAWLQQGWHTCYPAHESLGRDQFFVRLLIRLCRSLRQKRSLCRHDEPLFQEESGYQRDQGKDQNGEKAGRERTGERLFGSCVGRQMAHQVAGYRTRDGCPHDGNAQGCSHLSQVAQRCGADSQVAGWQRILDRYQPTTMLMENGVITNPALVGETANTPWKNSGK